MILGRSTGDRMSRRKGAAVLAITVTQLAWTIAAAANGLYPTRDLTRETAHLERAVNGIFKRGLEPHLTRDEARALSVVRFEFPLPGPDDPYLNFYAGHVNGRPTVILPLQSLKLVEALTIAFAWSYHTGRNFGPLNIYFAMVQRKALDDFGSPDRRDMLNVLGVPGRIWETNKAIDRLSLSLRNEAFAFVLAHELGHLRYRHGSVAARGTPGARADEIQSDAFALDLLARTGTPPMGAIHFF